jgi:hypothetical protein
MSKSQKQKINRPPRRLFKQLQRTNVPSIVPTVTFPSNGPPALLPSSSRIEVGVPYLRASSKLLATISIFFALVFFVFFEKTPRNTIKPNEHGHKLPRYPRCMKYDARLWSGSSRAGTPSGGCYAPEASGHRRVGGSYWFLTFRWANSVKEASNSHMVQIFRAAFW